MKKEENLSDLSKKNKEIEKNSNRILKEVNNYNKPIKIAEIIVFIIVMLFLIIAQNHLSEKRTLPNDIFKTLEGPLLELYSFIISLLSLYGIYFALIQFVIDISSNNNIFFGVNYARRILEESYIFRFLRSKLFYIYLVCLVVLPIIYKLNLNYLSNFLSIDLNKFIVYFWNATVFFLTLAFVISLNFGFTKIWDISTNNTDHKRWKCYETTNFFITKSFDLYLINEDNNLLNVSLDLFFDQVLDFKNRFKENEYEENYFMNNFLKNCNISKIKQKEEFFSRYMDILIGERVKLVYSEQALGVDYPLVTIIENLGKNNIDKGTSIFQKHFSKVCEFLNNQDRIFSYRFAKFILDMYSHCDYKMISELLNLYINKCDYIKMFEQQLFHAGSIGRLGQKDEFIKYTKIFHTWIELFTKYENEKIKLILPINGYIYFNKNEYYEYIYENIYGYAAIYYLMSNPTSLIFKELYQSLNGIEKYSYDINLQTENVLYSVINKDLYIKLANEYKKSNAN